MSASAERCALLDSGRYKVNNYAVNVYDICGALGSGAKTEQEVKMALISFEYSSSCVYMARV